MKLKCGSISTMVSANYYNLYWSPTCSCFINMNYRVGCCNICYADSLEDDNLRKLYLRNFKNFIYFSLFILSVSSFLALNNMTWEVWFVVYFPHRSCEKVLPEFSQEFIHQNLRKYIQIALLFFGWVFFVGFFFFLKKDSYKVSIRNCIWSFHFPKGKVYFFGRMVCKVWRSTFLQSGSCLCKHAAEFGTSLPCDGNYAWSGVLKRGRRGCTSFLPPLLWGKCIAEPHSNPLQYVVALGKIGLDLQTIICNLTIHSWNSYGFVICKTSMNFTTGLSSNIEASVNQTVPQLFIHYLPTPPAPQPY